MFYQVKSKKKINVPFKNNVYEKAKKKYIYNHEKKTWTTLEYLQKCVLFEISYMGMYLTSLLINRFYFRTFFYEFS